MSLDEEERAREREKREAVLEEKRQAKRARAEPRVATVIPQTLMVPYSADEAKRAELCQRSVFIVFFFFPWALLTMIIELVLLHTHILSKHQREGIQSRKVTTSPEGTLFIRRDRH